MTIATVRRLAADIMNVGRNKIRISPDGMKEAEGALTRADVKGLIDKGVITKLKPAGRASKKRTKRRGHGRRRGSSVSKKDLWMEKIRAQRRFLRMLLEAGALNKSEKRNIYQKVKSGIFRNKSAMLLYLKENGLVANDYKPPKPEMKKPNATTTSITSNTKDAKAEEGSAKKPAKESEKK